MAQLIAVEWEEVLPSSRFFEYPIFPTCFELVITYRSVRVTCAVDEAELVGYHLHHVIRSKVNALKHEIDAQSQS